MAILTINADGKWADREQLTIAAGSEPHPEAGQDWQLSVWTEDGDSEITISLKRERAQDIVYFLNEYLERTK